MTTPSKRRDCVAVAAATACVRFASRATTSPTEITSDSNVQEVIDILGLPTAAGGDREPPPLGYVHPWIKYHRTDCQLRFEFNKGKGLRMISVVEPNWQAGK